MYKSKVKVADFRDKASLGKLLKTDLKKSLAVLDKNQGETLPFFFEYDYIAEGESFLAVGRSNDLIKLFKKRAKGAENGEKINKLHVAYGDLFINDEGTYCFVIHAGKMKPTLVKKAIKGNDILKKVIKENYTIMAGMDPEGQNDANDVIEGKSVETLETEAKALKIALKGFSTTELAAIKENPKKAMPYLMAWKSAQVLADDFSDWIAEADATTAKDANAEEALKDERTIIGKAQDKLAEMMAKIAPKVQRIQDKLDGQKGTPKEMPSIEATIKAQIEVLLNEHKEELNQIPGLREALEAVKL